MQVSLQLVSKRWKKNYISKMPETLLGLHFAMVRKSLRSRYKENRALLRTIVASPKKLQDKLMIGHVKHGLHEVVKPGLDISRKNRKHIYVCDRVFQLLKCGFVAISS